MRIYGPCWRRELGGPERKPAMPSGRGRDQSQHASHAWLPIHVPARKRGFEPLIGRAAGTHWHKKCCTGSHAMCILSHRELISSSRFPRRDTAFNYLTAHPLNETPRFSLPRALPSTPRVRTLQSYLLRRPTQPGACKGRRRQGTSRTRPRQPTVTVN